MDPASHLPRLSLDVQPRLRGRRAAHRDRSAERAAGAPGPRLSGWLRARPRWMHAAPYLALVLLGAVLLVPGIVPHGAGCGGVIGAASQGARQLFIAMSAVAFGLVAALLLLSAVTASAQRRAGRPGKPTIVCGALLGVVTLAAVISPHVPLAAPAEAVMVLDVVGLLATHGVALAIPIVAAMVAWSTLTGPRSLRAAQIAAWTVLLLGVPLVMAYTYLAVTPICVG